MSVVFFVRARIVRGHLFWSHIDASGNLGNIMDDREIIASEIAENINAPVGRGMIIQHRHHVMMSFSRFHWRGNVRHYGPRPASYDFRLIGRLAAIDGRFRPISACAHYVHALIAIDAAKMSGLSLK